MSKLVEISLVEKQAIQAKKAAKSLSLLSEQEKNEALFTLADHLEKNTQTILAANEKDLEAGKQKGYDAAYLDRLSLTKERVFDFAEGLRTVAALKDPVGETLSEWTLENGLKVKNVRVPLGVIGMIYEARPNVTVDATGLALKSGNAIVLKGGSSAISSNKAIVSVMHEALENTKISRDAVQFIESTDRSATKELFTMKQHIDVLIPRGGGALIQAVVENATVPVLETGVGNCHLYIDREADTEKAINIMVNAKTDRPAVCNALETLIVHEDWLNVNHEALAKAFKEHGIQVHGDEKAVNVFPEAIPAEETDWKDEYLSLDIAVKVVESLEEAVAHIDQYGTKHSEAIVTENDQTALFFMNVVDAAALYHNASTRFTDGGALGFGAEIGISTQKLHARGPMGLPALTTSKYLMVGNGQTR
ncbi:MULTISPECIES: glutamate-5-semialdehyde dehydrogenase [Bacillus]|uniref:Gamma-glutamyl phosphate reductase n=2 Tax=Bacillus TaxID=1386 RepID=A0A0M5JAV9_9BACI|nr:MULTISPECIES: glutamate-5-semialdehyde dehydrogenase [Bacillus]ALC83707.1 gamma-glutamyl phosphate reductase [Bacillus gobiensis]MBP1082745.1 glutamate-5-semialdehyde dehydrogenase [Bacillus capparidis]MED1097039.1 glutamate-5-semialdehyde dehydrogenase [Bacillus capparidis]